MDSHIILSGEEMYALIDLVKKANQTRGVPMRRVWQEIEIFANTKKKE